MKLIYCFLISFLSGIVYCQAQIPLSIKAGATWSSMLINPSTKVIGGLGWKAHPIEKWYAGVASTLKMGKRFFFQPELLYSERGANITYDYYEGTLVRRFGYISMPLLLGWHPFKKMSILLGAEPGYLIWVRRGNDRYTDRTYEDADRRFNVDLDLGLACQVLPRWTVEVRGLAGLKGIYEEWGRSRSGIYKSGEYVGSHLGIQFGLRYGLIAK
jgi:hypothetical protein